MSIDVDFADMLNNSKHNELKVTVAKVHVLVQYTSRWEPQLRPRLTAFQTLSLSRRPSQAVMMA
jgi:hypothetical protein